MSLKKLPLEERPRERCLKNGPEQLSLRECLALLIGSGTPKQSALELAEELLHPSDLQSEDPENLIFIRIQNRTETDGGFPKGLGPARRTRIQASFEIARRYASFLLEQAEQAKAVSDSKVSTRVGLTPRIFQRIAQNLRESHQEWIGFIPVYSNNSLGDFLLVEKGARTHVNFDPAELFARVLALRPRGFLLFHNHPSGVLTPSDADQDLTEQVANLARTLNLELRGHWIIWRNRAKLIPLRSSVAFEEN